MLNADEWGVYVQASHYWKGHDRVRLSSIDCNGNQSKFFELSGYDNVSNPNNPMMGYPKLFSTWLNAQREVMEENRCNILKIRMEARVARPS